jgi:hypothetical protein
MTVLFIKCGLKFCIVGNKFPNETLLIALYIGASFHNHNSYITIPIDGVSLTSNEFNRSNPVVFYQYNTIIVRL